MVPAQTGMPSGSPVASAPLAVIVPATSQGFRIGGSVSPGAISSAHSWIHSPRLASYSGVQNAADTESSTYSPVRRSTMNEFGIRSCLVFSQISGWLLRIQASFGPIDWWDRMAWPRSRISSSP
jgi:hypothetical protein